MKLNTEEWKEFRIGDWFETENGKRTPTGSYVEKSVLSSNPGDIPRITVTGINNGVDGYYSEIINDPKYRIYENFISVTFLGDCFYQKNKASLDMKVHCLKPLDIKLNDKIALFLTTVIKKEISSYSYSNQLSSEDLKDITFNLPSKNNEPDWKFMEEYIKEIEKKYIDKVDEYNQENIQNALNITGIAEDELDKDLIINPANRYEEFRIGDLFEINPTKHYGLTNADLYQIGGENIVIANTSQNNGIAGYTNYENTEKGNMITFSDTTDHNSIFYQPKDFVGYSHVQGLYPLSFNEKWNKNTYLYFLTIFKKKAASKGFSYGYKFNRKLASKFKVVLPAIDEKTPDFDYMERYIYIYTKKVIKSWQLDNEKEINALKAVIKK